MEPTQTATVTDPLRAIATGRVVAVVREPDAEVALEASRWLHEQGVEAIELTASTPGWDGAVERLREQAPTATIGAGTLRSRDDARRALGAGAEFLVTPHPAPAVREVAEEAGATLIEGGMTPGEVLAACERGVAKLFPAHVGGPALLRSILALEPTARIVPTGGIGLDDLDAWFDAGAFAVGIGSGITRDERGAARLRSALTAARAR